MCLTYLAGEFLRRWGSPFQLRAFQQWILTEVVLSPSTMDPEAVQDPRQSPTPAPEPMTMERSLSSESGSNSSLSTVYFEKKSGSAASSRSGSGASTSRSPPDQEVAARLLSWPSPSFGKDPDKEQGHGEDDQSSRKVLVESSEKLDESKLVTKADSVGAVEPPQHETVIQELQKSSDTIVKEFRHTESIMIKEAEQAAESCCSCCRPLSGCCRSCTTWGICGDIAAVLCCPFTVISLLSCICFKCPKMFASKTAEKVKSIKSKGKGDEHYVNREESELEESTRTASEVSPRVTVKHKEGHCGCHHGESKGPHSHSEKKDSPIASHRNYFFPGPEAEDDRPGGDKSGGR